MDDFDVKSTAFLEELTSQKNASFHPNIRIQDLRHRAAGRGIIATADIPAETELFTIPRDYVISVENSNLHTQLPQIFEYEENLNEDVEKVSEDQDLPKPWLDLILVLIHDYLHRSTSRWQAYWNVLPSDFDTLMFWSDKQLAELQASHVSSRIGKASANQMFNDLIIPRINQHADVFYPPGTIRLSDSELLTLAHRMGTLIMSYAFDLQASSSSSPNDGTDSENDDEAEDGWTVDRDPIHVAMGMVPMADMLNADAEFNAHLEHSDHKLTMRSLRPILQGEEILNYYGALPNCELLRRYGYTSDKHARYDVVELSWNMIEQVIKEEIGVAKQPSTQEWDDEDTEDTFVLEREGGDPDDTGRNDTEAKFKAFPEELVEQTTAFIGAALTISTQKPDEQDNKRLKKAFLVVMSTVLARRLAAYATTLEQDQGLLALAQTQGRLRMAVEVRLGEKMLLKEAEALVQELLIKYADVDIRGVRNGHKQGPPLKKQKRTR